MKLQGPRHSNWTSFFCELVLYSALVLAYFGLVLHYLAHWLKDIFDQNHLVYAIVALLLMIGQAVGLEAISSFIFGLVRRKKK